MIQPSLHAIIRPIQKARPASATPGGLEFTACAERSKPCSLRYLVRHIGVWRGVVLFTLASTVVAFLITGLAMHFAGLDHRIAGYSIALACSVTIMPAMVASLLSLIRRLDETEHQLYRLARTDELTTLPNRRALMEAAARPALASEPLALLFIDIDHFKRVNDTYGHRSGDQILCQVTRALASELREADLLCRYGGEEFAALLRDTDVATAGDMAERLRAHIENTAFDAETSADLHVTVSIGVACAADARTTGIYDLIDHADRALYQAKHGGRNCTCAA